MTELVEHHNQSPKAFVWTLKLKRILEKVAKARAVLNHAQSI